ncbi:MAG: hypothetical protein HXS49_04690, partial [Theionarchaea archaeon]|nr:hypothetical protein [Theionarchaea archaeon]MBU7034464.1 hypothetical protein [Theionarchaea archaeon]MBU7039787.1 hypothetical protein [Theionarchaea archaeon]
MDLQKLMNKKEDEGNYRALLRRKKSTIPTATAHPARGVSRGDSGEGSGLC